MEPESVSHDSDRDGSGDMELEERGALLGGHYEEKTNAPPHPGAGWRTSSLIWMFFLFFVSIVTILSFTLVDLAQLQGAPPLDADDDAAHHDQPPTKLPPVGITYNSTDPSSMIPPNDFFDLKRTGFVVSADKPQLRSYVFNITRSPGAPDGVTKPEMILVNGQSPGPLIEANVGDTVRVVVHNSMVNESTTIHWHGIDQRDSVFMDGVAGVTQCGIPPGESFTYQFDLPNQRGSFWYHAHVSVQYTDGLFGPLIIHDPDEKVPAHDDDRIIMIGDLHHMDARQAAREYLSTSPSWEPANPGMEPYPDNTVINGRSTFNCTKSSGFRDCASGTLYTAPIKPKTTTRLRLISHSSNTPYLFTVDGHTLSIVEIDGVEVVPVLTTRVYINPGQRYSVLVHADQAVGNYLMRAVATCAMLDRSSTASFATVDFQATAILSYEGAPDGGVEGSVAVPIAGAPWALDAEKLPSGSKEPWKQRCRDLPFDLAKPIRELDAFEVGADNIHYVFFSFGQGKDGVTRTYINGTVFSPRDDAASIWALPGDPKVSSVNGSAQLQTEQHVFVSRDEGMAAQVAISAGNMMGHPWHLHGQQFQIVGWGKGVFGKGDAKTHWNLKNPLRRDTITVPGHSHVVIRYAADNPGVWALHCHIQWHAEGGMFAQTVQQAGKLRDMIGAMDDAAEDIRMKFCAA